jgi:hypothetical protein
MADSANTIDNFYLNLSNASSGTITVAKATCTINNDTGLDASSRSPLVLDLNGDGVGTISKDAGVQFDHDADGTLDYTGWVDSRDALLTLDLNGNGSIDSGREIFGNNTLLADGSKASNGFEALAQYDDNKDGKIDAQDAIYSKLQLWQDANSDGVSQSNELTGLEANRVQAINLDFNLSDKVENGNSYAQVGSYTNTQGQTLEMTDVWFATGKVPTDDLFTLGEVQTNQDWLVQNEQPSVDLDALNQTTTTTTVETYNPWDDINQH